MIAMKYWIIYYCYSDKLVVVVVGVAISKWFVVDVVACGGGEKLSFPVKKKAAMEGRLLSFVGMHCLAI